MCERLSLVTFGESSSLKLIGNGAFWGSDVPKIHVPYGDSGLLNFVSPHKVLLIPNSIRVH